MAVLGRRRGERGCYGPVAVRTTGVSAFVAALLAAVLGCSASSHPVEDDGDAAACAAAGGTCVTTGGVRPVPQRRSQGLRSGGRLLRPRRRHHAGRERRLGDLRQGGWAMRHRWVHLHETPGRRRVVRLGEQSRRRVLLPRQVATPERLAGGQSAARWLNEKAGRGDPGRHGAAHREVRLQPEKRWSPAGTRSAQLGRMARLAVALRLLTVATVLAAATGCGTSSASDGDGADAATVDANAHPRRLRAAGRAEDVGLHDRLQQVERFGCRVLDCRIGLRPLVRQGFRLLGDCRGRSLRRGVPQLRERGDQHA